MKKNVSGQKIGGQMVSATDGSAFTGAVTVYVTGDAGTQAIGSVGSGACTHEGNGYHTYAPAQAETNYDLAAFTFIGTGAIPATVQVFTDFPQTGDAYSELINGTYGLAALETLVDDLESRIGTPANLGGGATIAQNLSDIEAQTDDIGAAGAGLTALATAAELAKVPKSDSNVTWNSTALASINAEVDTALNTAIPGSPTADSINERIVAIDAYGAPPAVGAIADAVWDEVVTTGAHDTPTFAGKALLDAGGAGTPPTVGEIADAVWDEAATGHTDAGKAGAQLWTVIDAIAVDVAGLDGAAMRGTDSAALASVCTETRLSELDSGTPGKAAAEIDLIKGYTDDIGIAGAGLTALASQTSVDTIDDLLDTEVAAILAAVDTEVAAIKAKTDQLTFTKAGEIDANVQSVNGVTITGDGSGTPFGV